MPKYKYMKNLSTIMWCLIIAGCYSSTSEKTGKEGAQMPEFNLQLADSATWLNTANIVSGKATVFVFFSPTCPHCRAETQEIVEEIDDLKDIQFYFVTVAPLPWLKNYYNQFQMNKYANIKAGVDTAQFITKYFKIPGVPYTAIYGKDKKLISTFVGEMSAAQLKKVAEG